MGYSPWGLKESDTTHDQTTTVGRRVRRSRAGDGRAVRRQENTAA